VEFFGMPSEIYHTISIFAILNGCGNLTGGDMEKAYVCFYVTSTQYRSYLDIPALLVEEDLKCSSVHYFKHERGPE
jgi:hypothetical protein